MALFDLDGDDLREFRLEHKLSADQMADLLGYTGNNAYDQVLKIERGARRLMPPQALLLAAYLDGWRPEIWPVAEDLTVRSPDELPDSL